VSEVCASIPDKLVLNRCTQIAGQALAKQRGPEYFRKFRQSLRSGVSRWVVARLMRA
jgi:hypothetical protein